MIPEQIVQQYQSYCYETRFVSVSHNTLCGILKVCSASVRVFARTQLRVSRGSKGL